LLVSLLKRVTMTNNFTREDVLALMKEKDSLEEEIKGFHDVLKSQGAGMDDPLVDSEGFPRNDIDVYQVRTARHNIRCKNNDLKKIVGKIETGLHNIHAQVREGAGVEEGQSITKEVPPALARVVVVCGGSPADEAGIKQGDLIARFGSVNSSNFTSLKSISEVVEHSENRTLPVTLIRYDRSVRVNLTPKTWSGQGLLGFKIRPVGIEPDR